MVGILGMGMAAIAAGMARAFPMQAEEPTRVEPGSLLRSHEEAVEIIDAFKPEFAEFVGREPTQEELVTIYNVIRRSEAIGLNELRHQLHNAKKEHERIEKRKKKNGIAPWSEEDKMTRQQRRQRDRLAAKQRHF